MRSPDHHAIVEDIVINSSIERVFDAFFDPNARIHWWGHGRWRVVRSESELRSGGKWVLCVEAQGAICTARGQYLIVDRPYLVALTWHPDWYENPSQSIVYVEFMRLQSATKVRLTHCRLYTDGDHTGTTGWPFVLASLGDYLATR